MTLAGELRALGMREVRERIRAVVARVGEGNPLVIMQHGDPAAVLIRFDEAERWGRVERARGHRRGVETGRPPALPDRRVERIAREHGLPLRRRQRLNGQRLPIDLLLPLLRRVAGPRGWRRSIHTTTRFAP